MVDMTLSISGPQIVIPLTWSSNNIMRHIGNVYFAICSNISNDITSNWINWMLYWNTKHIVHDIGQSISMLLKSETALLATISQLHNLTSLYWPQCHNLTISPLVSNIFLETDRIKDRWGNLYMLSHYYGHSSITGFWA